MIAPLFDTCIICGRRTRKPGEALCIFHDIQALIELGYFRTIERMKRTNRGGITERRSHRLTGRNADKNQILKRS